MPRRPRSAVSKTARDTLTRLHEQIEAAEKLLRKLPGSRTDEAKVSLHSHFPDYFDHGESVYLEFHGENLGIVICFYRLDPSIGEEVCTTKRLDDYPTVTRIELAKKIPELIRLSKEAEGKVVSEATEAADSIEQAIAESMED